MQEVVTFFNGSVRGACHAWSQVNLCEIFAFWCLLSLQASGIRVVPKKACKHQPQRMEAPDTDPSVMLSHIHKSGDMGASTGWLTLFQRRGNGRIWEDFAHEWLLENSVSSSNKVKISWAIVLKTSLCS